LTPQQCGSIRINRCSGLERIVGHFSAEARVGGKLLRDADPSLALPDNLGGNLKEISASMPGP
jgi:hypothetical protein